MAGNGGNSRGPRCVALVGPFQRGKTTLLEAILGAPARSSARAPSRPGRTVGDASKEARHGQDERRGLGRHRRLHGRRLYLHRLARGSVEFVHEMRAALRAGDRRRGGGVRGRQAQGVAAPAHPARARRAQDPRILFLNKIDKADKRVRETRFSSCSRRRVPLLLRRNPIWKNEIITGFVDLALERALCLQGARAVRGDPAEGQRSQPRRRMPASTCWRSLPIMTTS